MRIGTNMLKHVKLILQPVQTSSHLLRSKGVLRNVKSSIACLSTACQQAGGSGKTGSVLPLCHLEAKHLENRKPISHLKTSGSVDNDVALSMLFERISLKDQSLNLLQEKFQIDKEYILPTISHNSIAKKTILDPLTNPQIYELPTFYSIVTEKVTPSLENIVPVEDPSLPGQAVEKHAMPWLMRIRHRKMKKHKLKKLRKRMIFVNRKRRGIKRKKKEKLMVLMEKEFKKSAEQFDAEQFVNENLELARKGGWYVDIFADKKQPSKNA